MDIAVVLEFSIEIQDIKFAFYYNGCHQTNYALSQWCLTFFTGGPDGQCPASPKARGWCSGVPSYYAGGGGGADVSPA